MLHRVLRATCVQGTVLIELGEDYIMCAEMDGGDVTGDTARIFRDAKLEEASPASHGATL